MKKKRITYGVSGMMEYQSVIKLGRSTIKVLFTDGSVSAMGVNPAKFTTDSYILQFAIENSVDYKRGLIKTVNEIELDEELEIERNAESGEALKGTSEERGGTRTEAKASGQGQIESGERSVESGEVSTGTSEEVRGTSEEKQEVKRMEFTCNDDAKDYLEQNFGYVRSKLRNREDIMKAGKAYNLEIVFV